MSSSVPQPDLAFYRFRAYLRILAEMQVGRRPEVDFDASDVVQQTLLDAVRDRGRTDAEVAAWLRRLLACPSAKAERNEAACRLAASRPVPIEGNTRPIRLWGRVHDRADVDGRGAIRVLSIPAWHDRREQSGLVGGADLASR